MCVFTDLLGFLREDCIPWKGRAESSNKELVGFLVGARHRLSEFLVFNGKALAPYPKNDVTCLTCEEAGLGKFS